MMFFELMVQLAFVLLNKTKASCTFCYHHQEHITVKAL